MTEFWLHTSYHSTRPLLVTLHRNGCEQLRIVRVKPRLTGPLTWDQLAAMPAESYVPCQKCRPASASRCSGNAEKQRPLGPLAHSGPM
jgi:hypothetical protein